MRAINQRWNKDHRRTRSLGMDELCRTFRPNTRQQRLRFVSRRVLELVYTNGKSQNALLYFTLNGGLEFFRINFFEVFLEQLCPMAQ